MYLNRIIGFLALILPAFCHAQWKAPVYSNEFLHLGADAAGLGTAGTGTSTTHDSFSFLWNPAGLSRMEARTQMGFSLGYLEPGKSRQQIATIANKVDSLTSIGFSFLRYASKNQSFTGNLEESGEVDFNQIGTFSSTHQAIVFTAARKNLFKKGLSMGLNFRVLYQEAGSFANGWGFGLDAGGQYTWKEWQLGFMVRDLLPTFNAWSYNPSEIQTGFGQADNVLPERSIEITLPSFHPSVARRFKVLKEKVGIQPAVQLPIFMDGDRRSPIQTGRFSVNPRLGITFDYKHLILLRGGFGEFEKTQGFRYSVGAGVRWKNIIFDYAFSQISASGNSTRNLVSLKLDL